MQLLILNYNKRVAEIYNQSNFYLIPCLSRNQQYSFQNNTLEFNISIVK